MPEYMDQHASAPLPRAAQVGPPHGIDWQRLYDELGERVFRMLHRMTGDAHVAEDLTHDVFVRVHETRTQYDGRGPVAAWVFRIAANCARDALRRRTARARRLSLYTAPDRSEPTDVELRLTLESALRRLDPAQRRVVLLHDVDGYSHAEIAEMLGIREGTSRVRLFRARAALRDALGNRLER